MKIVQMEGNYIHWITPYKTWEELPEFSPDIIFKETDDNVQEGYIWDSETNTFYQPSINLENPRKIKLDEVAMACENVIFAGIDVLTTKGLEHFSLTLEDQTNLGNLMLQAQSGKSVLYHADNELCRVFSPEEMLSISEEAIKHKIYHTTLCNHYNAWIRREDTMDLFNIFYGAELPHDLKESIQNLMLIAGI